MIPPIGQATWFVAVIYRPLSGNFQSFLDSMETIFTYVRDKNYENVIVTGDFNVDLFKNEVKSQQLIHLQHDMKGFQMGTRDGVKLVISNFTGVNM